MTQIMTNEELIAKIKAEIERQMNFYDGKERKVLDDPKQFTYALFYQGRQRMCAELLSFLSDLKKEEKPMNKDCNGCPHCVDRKDQYGWHFKGCFGGPYNGKFIAEIDECPLKQEQPEVDSEKPMNPDDAMKELDEKIALVKQRGTWDGVDVDKYMDEVRGREPGKPIPADLEEAANHHICKTVDAVKRRGWELETQDITDAFIAGAKWQKQHDAELIEIVYNDGITIGKTKQKEQMLKEAVEGFIATHLTSEGTKVTVNSGYLPKEFDIKHGDKVRIIIVNED